MLMILLVLHDLTYLDEVLTAWDESGVSGVTILPSTGMARLKSRAALQDDFPLIPNLQDLLDHAETQNRTLFTIVNTEAQADKVIAATEKVVGDLDLPNTGILAVIPIMKVKGLHRKVES